MMEHQEQLEKTLNIESKRPSVKCKVFEDNNSAIELAKAPKIRPRKNALPSNIITLGNTFRKV